MLHLPWKSVSVNAKDVIRWVTEMEARRGIPPHKTLGLLGLKLAVKGQDHPGDRSV